MRTPKCGEAYQICVHLGDESLPAERHYWRLPKRRWLVLCAACHARYSMREAVDVATFLRLFASAPDLGPVPAGSVHIAGRSPPPCIPNPLGPAPQPMPAVEMDLVGLGMTVHELMMNVLLHAQSWSPPAVRQRVKVLRARSGKLRQRLDTSGAASPMMSSRLAEIDQRLTHLETRMKLVERTRRRVGTLIRQAQRLFARTLSKPLGGYFYRRRVYRRLLRERDTLTSLVWLLNVPDSYWPPTWVDTLQDTFLGLQHRYGMPLSDSAMRRLVSQIPLADIAALASAMQHCHCRACIHSRQNTPLDNEQDMALLATCACAFCKFTRTTMPKIDLSTLQKRPDFRDGLLALRQRIGGTFN